MSITHKYAWRRRLSSGDDKNVSSELPGKTSS
jgi:hypothetical protein